MKTDREHLEVERGILVQIKMNKNHAESLKRYQRLLEVQSEFLDDDIRSAKHEGTRLADELQKVRAARWESES